MKVEVSRQALDRGRITASVKNLHPGYFAYVMATGIVSTAAYSLGPSWLSLALLAAACAGLVILGVALAARLIFFRAAVAADVRAPDRVFAFFTITAGMDVLGVRFELDGYPAVTLGLATAAAAVWLLLTYGVPATLLLTRAHDSVLGGVNGTWLLWIVATQSLSTAAAVLVRHSPSQAIPLAEAAAGLWSVGIIIYLVIITLILLRWLTVPMTPATLGPPYWILMGATAISVLAGARYLTLPRTIPVVAATAPFAEGFTYTLWAFGTWWIPLLLILGSWRHLRHHWPLTYEPTLWSIVFPLGMYSVATLAYGRQAHIDFMEPLARLMFWASLIAWVLVAAAFLVRVARHLREPASAPAPPGSGTAAGRDAVPEKELP